MANQQTKNPFTIDHDNKYIPIVKAATGEIQLSASFSIAEKTAILSDMDAEFITGDSCPKWQRWEKESYNQIMSLTALDLPPEALKKYRPLDAIRRRRAEQAAEISSRRRRASLLARKAAKLLKSEFGAIEVFLFGSLARRVGFTRWSDIDLASRGIPSERYLTAWTPPPSLQFPTIMHNTKEAIQAFDYTNMSCAELALVDEQGISINHSIASAAASLLAKMLVTKDLRYHCAYVSGEAGTQVQYNSSRLLKGYLKIAKGID